MGPNRLLVKPTCFLSGPGGSRTLDLFSAIEARSQLRYRPVSFQPSRLDILTAMRQYCQALSVFYFITILLFSLAKNGPILIIKKQPITGLFSMLSRLLKCLLARLSIHSSKKT